MELPRLGRKRTASGQQLPALKPPVVVVVVSDNEEEEEEENPILAAVDKIPLWKPDEKEPGEATRAAKTAAWTQKWGGMALDRMEKVEFCDESSQRFTTRLPHRFSGEAWDAWGPEYIGSMLSFAGPIPIEFVVAGHISTYGDTSDEPSAIAILRDELAQLVAWKVDPAKILIDVYCDDVSTYDGASKMDAICVVASRVGVTRVSSAGLFAPLDPNKPHGSGFHKLMSNSIEYTRLYHRGRASVEIRGCTVRPLRLADLEELSSPSLDPKLRPWPLDCITLCMPRSLASDMYRTTELRGLTPVRQLPSVLRARFPVFSTTNCSPCMRSIATHCPNLQEVIIHNFDMGEFSEGLVYSLPNLRCLQLHCRRVRSTAVNAEYLARALCVFGQSAPQLSHLTVSLIAGSLEQRGVVPDERDTRLVNSAIYSGLFASLTSLKMFFCPNITRSTQYLDEQVTTKKTRADLITQAQEYKDRLKSLIFVRLKADGCHYVMPTDKKRLCTSLNWARVGFAISFARANCGNMFAASGLSVCRHLLDKILMRDFTDANWAFSELRP